MRDPAKELMLERRKHIQHRGWLLRKSHQPETAERAGHRRRALLWRAVMESVVLDEDRLVSYSDASITENTRGVLGSTKKGRAVKFRQRAQSVESKRQQQTKRSPVTSPEF